MVRGAVRAHSHAAVATDIHWLHIPSIVTQYVYIVFLIVVFLLSMGNRPSGSKSGYMLGMIVFAALTAYMGVRCSRRAHLTAVRCRVSRDHEHYAHNRFAPPREDSYEPRLHQHCRFACKHVRHLAAGVAALRAYTASTCAYCSSIPGTCSRVWSSTCSWRRGACYAAAHC